jgi:hypothetical protein
MFKDQGLRVARSAFVHSWVEYCFSCFFTLIHPISSFKFRLKISSFKRMDIASKTLTSSSPTHLDYLTIRWCEHWTNQLYARNLRIPLLKCKSEIQMSSLLLAMSHSSPRPSPGTNFERTYGIIPHQNCYSQNAEEVRKLLVSTEAVAIFGFSSLSPWSIKVGNNPFSSSLFSQKPFVLSEWGWPSSCSELLLIKS